VPPGFDPETVPDITPNAMPIIVDKKKTIFSSMVTLLEQGSSKSTPVAKSSPVKLGRGLEGVSSDLIKRIREREQRKKDMNASKNPNSLIIQKLAQLVRDVTVTVWSHKPKSKKSTANVDLSKMCAEIKRKCATISLASIEDLLRLLSDEVATMCAATDKKRPPFMVAKVQKENETKQMVVFDVARIEHDFELGPVKRHLTQRIADLKG